LEGIHSRTDFDLSQHAKYSKKKIQYFDNDLNAEGKPYGNYTPFVVETSVGLDRLFLTVISLAYKEEKWNKDDGTEDSRVDGWWYLRHRAGVFTFTAKVAK
jgi:glycyl-tRNA synthetase